MECINMNTQNFVQGIICAISLFFSVLIILIILTLRVFEPLTRNIIISISFNFILQSVLFFIGFYTSGILCLIVSYLKSTLLLSAMIWASIIPKILYDVFVEGKENTASYFKYCNITCYLIIPSIYTLPFITDSFVGSYDHCRGLSDTKTGIIWRFLLLFFPAIVLSVKVIIYYIKIYKHLRKNIKLNIFEFIVNRGLVYTIAFIIIITMLTIARVTELIDNSCVSINLLHVAYCFIYTLGTLNGILTIARSDLRRAIALKILGLKRAETDSAYLNLLIN